MKKLIITLIILCYAIGGYSQEHLAFKGIPIEGNINSFCQKLKSKGFMQIHSQDNIRLFTGNFTGREATVGVVADQGGNDVYSVVILFPSNKEWNQLVNTYEYYKELYEEKYGTPTYHKEHNPSRMDSNDSLMIELNQGTVTYISIFEVPGGSIELSINKADEILKGQVVIRYKDSQNESAKRKSDLDEI